jgi:hypothetical protein
LNLAAASPPDASACRLIGGARWKQFSATIKALEGL